MIGFGRCLDLVDHLAQPILEFSFHACACLKQAKIQSSQNHLFEGGRHIAGGNSQGKPFDDCRFSNAGFACQDRVILPTPHENIDDLPNLCVATKDRIDFSFSRFLCQVDGKSAKRFLLAHRPGGHRAAGLAGRNSGSSRLVRTAQRFLGRTPSNFGEVIRQASQV